MTEASIIRIANLAFRWPGAGQFSLDIPRFNIAKGERIFIYGPSGSGKSTMLGLLGGVLVPQRGTIDVLGTDLTRLTATARDRFRADHVGFLFQQFNLVPYLSVIDNVLLPCRFSLRRCNKATAGGRSLREEAARLLSDLDLDAQLRNREVTTLSVGQQQRVAAARALIGHPDIVIADEPTSALDAERQTAFLGLLQRECVDEGATLLFVSHDRRLSTSFTREIDLRSINIAAATQEAA